LFVELSLSAPGKTSDLQGSTVATKAENVVATHRQPRRCEADRQSPMDVGPATLRQGVSDSILVCNEVKTISWQT